jgi:WD40 repeat protein
MQRPKPAAKRAGVLRQAEEGAQPPSWPSYTGTAQFVGTSSDGRVNVYVDPTLGADGLQNAQDLVSDATRVAAANDALFGAVGGPVSVIVFALGGATDGAGGAYHMGCDFVTGAAIEVCASFGSSNRVSALFEATLSECAMGGNLCGVSTGEALSRWCAAVISGNALPDFATAPFWAQNGMPDYVDQTVGTDQDALSTGCGMAFLSWLQGSLGGSLSSIAQAMVQLGEPATLADLYATLTGDAAANAFPNFLAAVQALPGGVTSDDPFSALTSQVIPPLNTALSAALPARATAVSERAAAASAPRSHRLLGHSRRTMTSSKIPGDLVQSCLNGECVLFAGAGLSAQAGVPVWDGFLRNLLAFARDSGAIDHEEAASLEAALREGQRNAAADGLVQAFANQRPRLHDFLRQSYPESTAPSSAHQHLQQVPFAAIVTSNYDRLLERVFPEFAASGLFTPTDAEALLDSLAQKRRFILKLYGLIERPETLIFAPLEYREALSSNVSFSKFMEGLFFSRNFLFVGLSLEGIQDFLSGFVFRGSNPRKHFALVAVAGSGWKATAQLLQRRYNINVISFPLSEKFPEVEDFARVLADATRRVAGPAGLTASSATAATPGVRRLVLADIGPFESLTLDFPKDSTWKILLGDNGVGKSTILKAIAVAIMGSDARSYAARLVRAGKTRGRITLITEQNPSGYVTDILTKDMTSEAEVVSIPSRPMEAEGWLALGFSPLRIVSWSSSTGEQPIVQKGRPSADDLVPLVSGESDPRMDRLKQWIVNLDAADRAAQFTTIEELRTLHAHKDRVSSLSFSADGRRLASASIDGSLRIWDVLTGSELRTIAAHRSGVNAVAFSATGDIAYSASHHGTIKVWDVESGTEMRTIVPSEGQILSLDVSADGRILAAGFEKGLIGVWELMKGEGPQRLGLPGAVWSVVLTADGGAVVSGAEDGSIRLWDTQTGSELRTFGQGGKPIWSVALSSRADRLISGSEDGSVRLWKLSTGRELRALESSGSPVMTVALAADGRTAACGCTNGTLKVWELEAARQSRAIRAHSDQVWSVALGASTLASASDDTTIKLWSIAGPADPLPHGAETIKKFFQLAGALTDRPDIDFLRVTDDYRVLVRVADVHDGAPIEILSQGLTSLFGWVGVLCQRLKETRQNPTNDPLPTDSYALVLIDEIDAHMHPLWQQVLVHRLKLAFPNVQFIASTHSPLIVGGLAKDEVDRFTIEQGKISKVDFEPDMTLGRYDQILTGELFNLPTALDPTTQELMAEYEVLLGKSQREPDEERRFQELARELEERIPPSPSDLVERRAAELLQLLQGVDLEHPDAAALEAVRAGMSRLAKTLRGEAAP